jgi:hypothetical protein
MRYILIDYMKVGGKITRTLINIGQPLTSIPTTLSYPKQFPLHSPSGEAITSPREVRGFNRLLEAKAMAEKLMSTRTDPVYFASYKPDEDRYEIRVVKVTNSKQGLNLGYPVLGVSHALRTFGFKGNGKIAMSESVKKRMDAHKADMRLARNRMEAPSL